jgi:hypothetical protein
MPSFKIKIFPFSGVYMSIHPCIYKLPHSFSILSCRNYSYVYVYVVASNNVGTLLRYVANMCKEEPPMMSVGSKHAGGNY